MKREGRYVWLFVVDTNQYAGNFEREMGAYLTGRVWKYFSGAAKTLAELYKQETGDLHARQFVTILGRHKSDGEHWPNYTDSWETPGWFNNGVGGHFRDGQEAEALEHHRKYYLKEARSVDHLHPNDQERTRQDWLARSKEPLFKWPAGMSVAIAFTERPTDEQIKILEERVMNFPKAIRRIKGSIKRHPEPAREVNVYFTGPIPRITGTRLLRRDGDRYIESSASS